MKVTKRSKKDPNGAISSVAELQLNNSETQFQLQDERLLSPEPTIKQESKKLPSFKLSAKQQQQLFTPINEPAKLENSSPMDQQPQLEQQLQRQNDHLDMTQRASYSKKLWKINRFKTEDVEKQSKLVQNAQIFAVTSDVKNFNKYGFKKTNVKPKVNKEGTPTEFLFVNCAPTRLSGESSHSAKAGSSLSLSPRLSASKMTGSLSFEKANPPLEEDKKQSNSTSNRVSRLFRSRSVKKESELLLDELEQKEKDKPDDKDSEKLKDKEKKDKEKKDKEKKDKDKKKDKNTDKERESEISSMLLEDVGMFSAESLRLIRKPFGYGSSSSSNSSNTQSCSTETSKRLTLKRLYTRKPRRDPKLKVITTDMVTTPIEPELTSGGNANRSCSIESSVLSVQTDYSMATPSTCQTAFANYGGNTNNAGSPFTPITPMVSTNSSITSFASVNNTNNAAFDYFAANSNHPNFTPHNNLYPASATPTASSAVNSTPTNSASNYYNGVEDQLHQTTRLISGTASFNNVISRNRSNSSNSVIYGTPAETGRSKLALQQSTQHQFSSNQAAYSPVINTPLQQHDYDPINNFNYNMGNGSMSGITVTDMDGNDLYDEMLEVSSVNTSNTKKLKTLKRSNSIVSINSISSQTQYPPASIFPSTNGNNNGLGGLSPAYGLGIVSSTNQMTFASGAPISRNRSVSCVSVGACNSPNVSGNPACKSPLRRSISQNYANSQQLIQQQQSQQQPQQQSQQQQLYLNLSGNGARLRNKSYPVDPMQPVTGVSSFSSSSYSTPLFDPSSINYPYSSQIQAMQRQSDSRRKSQLNKQSPPKTQEDTELQAPNESLLRAQEMNDFLGDKGTPPLDSRLLEQDELSYEELKRQMDELLHQDNSQFYQFSDGSQSNSINSNIQGSRSKNEELFLNDNNFSGLKTSPYSAWVRPARPVFPSHLQQGSGSSTNTATYSSAFPTPLQHANSNASSTTNSTTAQRHDSYETMTTVTTGMSSNRGSVSHQQPYLLQRNSSLGSYAGIPMKQPTDIVMMDIGNPDGGEFIGNKMKMGVPIGTEEGFDLLAFINGGSVGN